MKLRTMAERVYSRMKRSLKGPAWDFSDQPDWRDPAKIEWPLPTLVTCLVVGLLVNEKTLRDIERGARTLRGQPYGSTAGGLSDSTLYRTAEDLDPEPLNRHLVLQVRAMHRDKLLKPEGLPCGVVTIDGKGLGKLSHDACGTARRETDSTGKEYFLASALRATLVSTAIKPCLGQMAIPPGAAESSTFCAFVDELHGNYGRSDLFEVIDSDAGFTSLANMSHVNGLDYAYFTGLKENQPELLRETKRVLEPLAIEQEPEARTLWELRNGRWMRRSLWRTAGLAGWQTTAGTWTHLRQAILVRQESLPAYHEEVETAGGTRRRKHPRLPTAQEEAAPGRHVEDRRKRRRLVDVNEVRPEEKTIEDRYFITSLLWNRFQPEQLIRLVRWHWGVENDTFNSLDLQWREDATPWCTRGRAVWSLGLLRLMAYNQVQLLRKRILAQKKNDGRSQPETWRDAFREARRALELLSPMIWGVAESEVVAANA